MEESIANIQISKDPSQFLVKIHTALGGLREYKSKNFESILQQMLTDMLEEFEALP